MYPFCWRVLLWLALSLSGTSSWASYASTVEGTLSPDNVYLTGADPTELCAKFDRLRFRTDWYTHERAFFHYVSGGSGEQDKCVGYPEGDRSQAWFQFNVMECGTVNPVNAAWECAASEQPSVGTDSGVLDFVAAGPSLGGGSGEGGPMSVGWITDLTPEQGGQIAGAILAIWAFGWGIRVLIRTLNTVDGETQSESE